MKPDLIIETASGKCPVFTGEHILGDALDELYRETSSDLIFLLVDEQVFIHHRERLTETFTERFEQVEIMPVPSGEKSKSVHFWEKSVQFLLKNHIRRHTPVAVIGGGVTGDLGGFVAATVLRGVPYIHIPTTVLAMVDSSVGGKTGINSEIGKNLIGAFYQPQAVIADVSFLATLPGNEWINGLSEILKYGAIRDASIFKEAEFFLNENLHEMPVDPLISLIRKCIQIKAEVVREDEFESGVRAFLNFGHTFAHALEKACGFETISHGEAVFAGMLAARFLSESILGLKQLPNFQPFIPLYRYRFSPEALNYDDLYHTMKSDKKRTGDDINFVLLQEWQNPVVLPVSDRNLINEAWSQTFNQIKTV